MFCVCYRCVCICILFGVLVEFVDNLFPFYLQIIVFFVTFPLTKAPVPAAFFFFIII